MRSKRPAPDLWSKLRPEARRMRAAPTPAEEQLWSQLRRGAIDGRKFRRQHAIGRFIVDFYCPAASLVIELDGDSHIGRSEEDGVRQALLEQQELRVVRFTNVRVLNDLPSVISEIRDLCTKPGSPSSPLHRSGEGPGER